MSKYNTHRIKDIMAFVKFVHERCTAEDTLFRGQPIDEPLLPKLARLDFKEPILDTEQNMIGEFKRRSLPFLDVQPKSSWDWLAIAQHHGMATRLLDWTLNPLAALWFAVNSPPEEKNGKLRNAVVWILEPDLSDYATASTKESPFDIQRTKIYRPKHIVSRLVNQAGWFTVHKFMKTENRFIALERNNAYSAKLTKLIIPPESFSDMRFDLDRFNVNNSTLFPDIDGLCSHIQWLHTLLKDEKGVSKHERRRAS